MIVIGLNNTTSIYQGGENIAEVYQGNELIWGGKPSEDYKEALSITANAPSTIGLAQLGTKQTLEYTRDGKQWDSFDTSSSISLDTDDTVYFRGMLSGDNTSTDYTQFKIDGDVSVDGSCGYIWNYQEPDAPLKQYCGRWLFGDCTGLTSVGNILPFTELSYYCYANMFNGCTNLTKVMDELPALTLNTNCYGSMFRGCTSLKKAPMLPAPRLTDGCYSDMFNASGVQYIVCLAKENMSANKCLQNWLIDQSHNTGTFFRNPNTSWSSSTSGVPTGWMIYEYGDVPFQVVALEDSTIGVTSYNANYNISYSRYQEEEDRSNGWSGLTSSTSIDLKAGESLWLRGNLTANQSSSSYFRFNITGKVALKGRLGYLVKRDGYPSSCSYTWTFYNMFSECTGIYDVKELELPTWANSNQHNYMFQNCTSLQNSPIFPATTLASYCYSNMFYGCSNLQTAPSILPATTLASYCYYSMFRDCKNLQNAPELPATTLLTSSYQNMFNGCSKLNYIKCLAENISTTDCTTNWVSGVASNGTFVKSANMNSWKTGASGIPSGWTVETLE